MNFIANLLSPQPEHIPPASDAPTRTDEQNAAGNTQTNPQQSFHPSQSPVNSTARQIPGASTTGAASANANANAYSALPVLREGVDRLIAACRRPDERGAALATLRDYCDEAFQQSFVETLMPELVSILQSGETISDFINPVLDMLVIFCSKPVKSIHIGLADYFAVNSRLIANDVENINCLLNLLELRDFHVKYNAIQLLRTLLENSKALVQENIMKSPQGVIRLIDALTDRREAIRNDLLLLFTSLTDQNEEIQKIVVFNGVIDHLLRIISSEGGTDGGIVVQDTLVLMISMLNGNSSNQKYFREMGYLQGISDLLHTEANIQEFHPDKIKVFVSIFGLLELLVRQSQPNPKTIQDNIKRYEIIPQILHLALASYSNPSFRSKCLSCLATIMKDHTPSQTTIMSYQIILQTEEKMDCVLRLLLLSFNTNNNEERSQTINLVETFLSNNPDGQMSIVNALLPIPLNQMSSAKNADSLNSGKLILSALLDPSIPLHSWISANTFAWVFSNNINTKETMLRVRMPRLQGQSALSSNLLIHHLTRQIWKYCGVCTKRNEIEEDSASTEQPTEKKGKNQTSPEVILMSMFIVLCLWMEGCPKAVLSFLQVPMNLSKCVEYATIPAPEDITDQKVVEMSPLVSGFSCLLLAITIESNDESDMSALSSRSILEIVESKIGMESFYDQLEALCSGDGFDNTKKRTNYQAEAFSVREMFNVPFILMTRQFFEKLRAKIYHLYKTPRIQSMPDPTIGMNESSLAELVSSYSGLIQQQEQEITELRKKVSDAKPCESEVLVNPEDYIALQSELVIAKNKRKLLEDEALKLKIELDTLSVEDYENTIQMNRQQLRDVSLANANLEENISEIENAEQEAIKQANSYLVELEKLQALSHRQPSTDEKEKQLRETISALTAELHHTTQEYEKMKKENEDLLLALMDREEAGENEGEDIEHEQTQSKDD